MDRVEIERIEGYALERIPQLLDDIGLKYTPYIYYAIYCIDARVLRPNVGDCEIYGAVATQFEMNRATLVYHLNRYFKAVNAEHKYLQGLPKSNVTGNIRTGKIISRLADIIRKEYREKYEAVKDEN